MATKASQALENTLRFMLTETNLPSQYPDFQAMTRDLIRRLSPFAVIVDRATFNDLTGSKATSSSQTLAAATARYAAHNDRVEAEMVGRGSIIPEKG